MISDRAYMWASAFPLLMLRVCVAVVALLEGGLFGGVYAVGEFAVIYHGLRNLQVARLIDVHRVGVVIPIVYAMGFVILPQGPVSGWLGAAFVLVNAFRLWALCSLGASFTSGVATWVKLRQTGVYAYLRHPMTAASILWRICVVLAWPHWWNFVGGGVFVFLLFVELLVEERFLKMVPEWCHYADRVRWRLLPGVW